MLIDEFKKLLDNVKNSCPGVITEAVYDDMVSNFESGISDLTAEAEKAGQAQGFREGYEEGKKVAAEQTKKECDALIEKLDEEATLKLKNILEMIDADHTTKLQEVYDFFKKTTVPMDEHIKIIETQDNEAAAKLEKLYGDICENHANKLEKVVELLNKRNMEATENKVKLACEEVEEANLAKLEEIVDEFDKKLKKVQDECEEKLEAEKARKVEILAESVERYLSYACSKHIPTKKLIAEHKYNTAMTSLNKVIDILKVNNIIQESKDEFFEDINKQLEEAKEKQNQLINESIELKSQLALNKCTRLLDKTYTKCAPAEVTFIKNYFKNVNPANICEESIKEARIAYKKLYAEKRESLKKDLRSSNAPSSIISESSIKEEPVAKQPVVEQKKETIDMYVDMLG
jgi:hypothetical protein